MRISDWSSDVCSSDLGELALVARLGAGDAARDDLAVLGQVLAQGVEILVVDLLDTLGGELAVLAAAKELGHVCAPQAASAVSSAAGSAGLSLPLLSLSLSSSRRRRSLRSGDRKSTRLNSSH